MIEISFAFLISVFFAGIIMFLAPCTLPLVPAYLAFISGFSEGEIGEGDNARSAKQKIRINGTLFAVGFSVVFILFGMLAGLFGSYVAPFRSTLTIIGGLLILLLGLLLLGVFKIETLQKNYQMRVPRFLMPGQPLSAFIIGATFAVGWTPCVGPILASVLLVASSTTTALSGGLLLALFSLGMAIPFLLIAFFYGSVADRMIHSFATVSVIISKVGAVFLIAIALLMLTGNFGLTIQYGYTLFDFLNYDALLQYL